jgi:hypothetical protein
MEILCGTKTSESDILGSDGGEVMLIKPRYVLNSGFNNLPDVGSANVTGSILFSILSQQGVNLV